MPTLTMGLLLAVALAGPAPAAAEEGRQTFAATFTTAAPGQSTGVELEIDYVNPADPGKKPPAVAEILIEMPPGGRVDTSVPPRCDAVDPLLIVLGPLACPAGSVVGRGELVLHTGVIVSEDDVTLLNAHDELIFITRPKELPIPGGLVTRSSVEGGTAFRTAVPPIPGLPPGGPYTALDHARLKIDPHAGSAGGYLTTPPVCPAEGFWTITATFEYRDGVTQQAAATSPCEASPPGGDG